MARRIHYWDEHWGSSETSDAPQGHLPPANPYAIAEARNLKPGTALDAGCGVGMEALWLASQGWQVTGADISGQALQTAAEEAAKAGLSDRVAWVETDLTTWQPHPDHWGPRESISTVA